MKANYICYDGVDGQVTYHDTKEEAIEQLKWYIDNGLEDGEWMNGISDSFVAEITTEVHEREVDKPEDYKQDMRISKFIEMDIVEKEEGE